MGVIAVALSGGCLRFGYGREAKPAVQTGDASVFDAGGGDAGVMDAAASGDAAYSGDAAHKGDAADSGDAAAAADTGPRDGGADAGDSEPSLDASVVPQDGGMDAAVGGELDAATRDAGMEDAAIRDAAMEAGTIDPCIGRTDLEFCGGFEGSEAWSSSLGVNATATVTDERAHAGSFSLHLTSGAASSSPKYARRDALVFNGQSSGNIWARAFLYLTSATVIDANTALAVLRLSEDESPYGGCSFVIRTDYVELAGVSTRYRALSPFPRDKWTCVELHVEIDATAGWCNAYVDSSQASQSHQMDTLPDGGYGMVSVGMELVNSAQGPIDLYIDDVAADYTRIGCN